MILCFVEVPNIEIQVWRDKISLKTRNKMNFIHRTRGFWPCAPLWRCARPPTPGTGQSPQPCWWSGLCSWNSLSSLRWSFRKYSTEFQFYVVLRKHYGLTLVSAAWWPRRGRGGTGCHLSPPSSAPRHWPHTRVGSAPPSRGKPVMTHSVLCSNCNTVKYCRQYYTVSAILGSNLHLNCSCRSRLRLNVLGSIAGWD